ncbi:MAG: LLM class flavin-dependent oxidoreductase [Candidatus Bathyarchaeia archaeon]
MSFSLMLSGNGDLSSERVGSVASIAEGKGFSGIWFGETTLRDASVLATIAASKTEKIRIGTSIVNIFTRSAGQLALFGSTLNEFSHGRFTLGLGVSTAAIVENWHGIPFTEPSQKLEETVNLLKKYFSGERFSSTGKLASPKNARLRIGIPPKIALAALNDRMVRKAASLADRIILNLYPTEQVKHAISLIETQKSAERVRPLLSIMLYADVLGNDEEGEDAARELVSFYSSAPAYSTLFSKIGFDYEAKAMLEAWKSKDKDSVKRKISRKMIDELMVIGNISDLRERVKVYHENGVDDVFICPSPFRNYQENVTEILNHYP